MLHRTIFIGLGSTGCNTIDAIQDIAYLSTGSADMGGAWAYLKLDTAVPTDKSFCGDTAHSIHIQVAEPEIRVLSQHLANRTNNGTAGEDLSWLWQEGKLRISGKVAGSGLNRRYGRACVYYYWNVEHNLQKNIKSWLLSMKNQFIAAQGTRSPLEIQKKLASTLPEGSPVPVVSDQEVKFVIILALGGGTGTGGLLELARRIHNDGVSTKEIMCLSYPPSINHPQPGQPGGNDRRYNALECLYYYEQYLIDPNSPKNLRPHFIISPSKENMDLAPTDNEAMRQLEYLGAIFLTRISVALDVDAIMVDKIAQFPQPFAWSVAFGGVRVPALEIKASEIFKAIARICNNSNSSDPISWHRNVQLSSETMEDEATWIVRECFETISKFCLAKFSTLDPPRKDDFYGAYINNKDNWFDDNYERLSDEMLKHTVERIKSTMHSTRAARSIRYIEELINRIKSLLGKIPGLNDENINKAYKMLRHDPPSPQGRNKLVVWKYREVVLRTISRLEEKLEEFKTVLEGVEVNQEAIQLIMQRESAVFYRNIWPDSFSIEIPSLSFMDLEPVLNMFIRPQEHLSTQELKRGLMKELSRRARLPESASFDRSEFSNSDTKEFLHDKIDWPMLNLQHTNNLTSILKVCLGKKLTDLIDEGSKKLREDFNQEIADLDLEVATDRVDPVLTRIMSPLQLDAIKIWGNCMSEDLSINLDDYQQDLLSSNDPSTWGDYYSPRPGYAIAINALKNLLICSRVSRPDASHLLFIDVLTQYRPTVFGTTSYSIRLQYSGGPVEVLELSENDNISDILGKLIQTSSTLQGKEFLKQWNQYISSRWLTDTELSTRIDKLFELGEFLLTLPDGKQVTIYKPQI